MLLGDASSIELLPIAWKLSLGSAIAKEHGMDDTTAEAVEAAHGSRMLEIKVRFFTNELAPEAGRVLPKEGWTRGVVRMTPNDAHGIESGRAIHFNSLMELPAKIEQLLIDHGVVLHAVGKTSKYLVE